jgi:hypothetical protein
MRDLMTPETPSHDVIPRLLFLKTFRRPLRHKNTSRGRGGRFTSFGMMANQEQPTRHDVVLQSGRRGVRRREVAESDQPQRDAVLARCAWQSGLQKESSASTMVAEAHSRSVVQNVRSSGAFRKTKGLTASQDANITSTTLRPHHALTSVMSATSSASRRTRPQNTSQTARTVRALRQTRRKYSRLDQTSS